MTPQQRADILLAEHQGVRRMIDPMDTIEVAVEQRLVGLYSATKALKTLSRFDDGRKVIARAQCLEDLEIIRDQLSRILDEVGGK